MRQYILRVVLSVMMVGMWSAPVGAIPATRAATAPVAGALRVTVTAVRGMVEVRADEAAKWQAVRVGLVLGEGAEFRTGPRSAVTFTVPPDQTITLDRLGTVKVLTAVREGQKIITDLGMKYGRTRYDIEAAGLEHSARIQSPGSTLAVRGTDVIYQDEAPFVPMATSVHGRVEFRAMQRRFVAFGDRRPIRFEADKPSSARTEMSRTRVDTKGRFGGKSESEDAVVLQQPTTGSDQAVLDAIAEAKSLGGFRGNFIGVIDLPGPLSFELIWQPAAGSEGASNLNLAVTDPSGRTVSVNAPVVGTGNARGRHGGDDPGKTGAGAESVVWPQLFPAGRFTVRVNYAGGTGSAQTFVLVARQDTNTIKEFGTNPNRPIILKPGATFRGTVNVRGNDAGTPARQRGNRR